MKILLLSTALLTLAGIASAQAQAAETADAGEQTERVQYALILPEEKTPEMVKADENNPFESPAETTEKNEGNSEENQVRDILLRLPAVGGASGPSGMRIMLGGMRLVEGGLVPPVLPDQQVALRVKSITPAGIELVWVEKKPSGLPPKVLMIPMDGAAKVRYRLPNGSGAGQTSAPGGGMGAIRRNGAPVLMQAADEPPALPSTPAEAVAARLQAEIKRALPASPEVAATEPMPAPPPPTPAKPAANKTQSLTPQKSNVPEASVLRMLFGNHTPPAK